MKRSTAIDWMKALSILYIVGFWHLFNYTQAIPFYENNVTFVLAIVVLGLFVLISGFLMGKKNIDPTISDIKTFYQKRLLRIYPPYLGALVLYAILNISPLKSLVLSIIPVSLYLSNSPLTLWYIVMLLGFYILTPALLIIRKPWKLVAASLAIETLLIAASSFTESVDARNAIYFPAYAIGIILASQPKIMNILSTRKTLIPLIGSSLSLFAYTTLFMTKETVMNPFLIPGNMALATLISITVFLLMMKSEDRLKSYKLIEIISYSSFFLYLFHRPIYKPMTYFLMPESDQTQIMFLLGLCLPLAIGFAWLGQRIYDMLLDRFLAKIAK